VWAGGQELYASIWARNFRETFQVDHMNYIDLEWDEALQVAKITGRGGGKRGSKNPLAGSDDRT